MRVRNHGKYTRMNAKNPRGIARCDYSGLMVAHASLKDQYQYRGTGLVKTGYLVYPKFLDEPNPQDLIPLIKVDPVPLRQPRPDNVVDVPTLQILELDVSGNVNITLTNTQASNTSFIFKGVLTGDVIIFVPGSFNDFFVTNIATGGFSLSMQIANNSTSIVPLTPNQTMLLCNDGYTLHVLNSTN